MKSRTKAVLGMAALVFLAALCVAFLAPDLGTVSRVLAGGCLLFGVTVTYAYPVSGITAPTASLMKHRSLLTVVVIMADGDATADVTHNWGLSVAELADLFPIITWEYVTPGAAATVLTFARLTNKITITKAAGVGSGSTFAVTLMRPHTIIR